jgi:predicted deacylase
LNWVAVADFIEHVDQQAFMLGRRIGDRVEVGGVIAIITASEAKRRVDANAARTDG